uniref:NADH dehydrogenase subunit 4L n=1 Tax=Ayyaria chaetophora TaxID=1291247 RepID=UPI0030E4BE8D
MISFFLFLVFVYFSNFYSFLISLLILESLSLVIYYMVFFLVFFCFSLKFSVFFFVFIVCESAMGLTILVKCLKVHGSDNFRFLNLLMF